MTQLMKQRQSRRPACEDPEWCPQCSFAAHCHEQRVGETSVAPWPAVALLLLVLIGGMSMLLSAT